MSDETRIIETTEIRQVTYVIDGVQYTDDIEIRSVKHVRKDGSVKKLVLQPQPIQVKSTSNKPGG